MSDPVDLAIEAEHRLQEMAFDDVACAAGVVRAIRHYLDHRLEQFTPRSTPWNATKTSGYLAAKIPDWQLRQWLHALAPIEAFGRDAQRLDGEATKAGKAPENNGSETP